MVFFLRLLERPQPWGLGPPGRAGPPEKQGTGLGGSPGPQPHLREIGRKETEHGASHCSLEKATSRVRPYGKRLLPPPSLALGASHHGPVFLLGVCSNCCPYPSGCQAKSHSPFSCGFRPCHFYWGRARGWRRPFSSTLSTGLS